MIFQRHNIGIGLIYNKRLLVSIAILFYGGCIPRGADGRYHSVYSYHPYNNIYRSSHAMQEPFFIPPSNRQSRVSDAHPNRNLLLKIESFAKSQLGKRYQWGANGPYAFDCSGFTKFVYEQNGISLPRISREQAEVGRRIDFDHLQKGDLIFFDSEKSSGVSHTGIYLGENRFIHASSSKKRVTISHLSGYYQKHFKWGRRVIR